MFKKNSGKSKTYRQTSKDTLSKSRNTLLKSPNVTAKIAQRATYNKTLTNLSLNPFRQTKTDLTYDSLRRPVGSMNCRRSSDHEGVRGTTRAILLTGGLEVSKEGFVSVKEAKFATQYKKRYVIFEQGLVKLFDPQILKNLRLRNFKDPNELDNYAEQKLPITELKNITYEKRKGKVFSLTFRTVDNNKSNSNHTKVKSKRNTANSNPAKSLTSPVNFATIAASLLPKKSEFTFYFKTASGTESDDWVQSILYEIRNQACFIDRTINMLQRRKTAHTFTFTTNNNNNTTNTNNTEDTEHTEKSQVESEVEEKLDILFRQSVDLWALAKGKVSTESLESLNKFISFLRDIESDEVGYWSQTVEIITNLLSESSQSNPNLISGSFSGSFSEDISALTGLEQLQKLNEEEFHLSSERNGTFRSTIVNTLIKKTKKATSTTNITNTPNATSNTNIEISPEIRKKRLTKRTFSDEQKLALENNFKSALDMKEERQFEEDKQALQRISAKRLDIKLNEQTKEEDEDEENNQSRKESEMTKML